MATNTAPVNEDTLITIKITFDDCTKKLKLPLKDLGAHVLPAKLRHLLCIAEDQVVVFERYSDSAGGYVVLDPANSAVFKTLMRAAKAKLKLKLRASAPSSSSSTTSQEGPVIARTPVYAPSPRDSTGLDQRSLGAGIFEFRNAQASHNKAARIEAPLPRPFDFVLPPTTEEQEARKRTQARCGGARLDVGKSLFSVFCNVCDQVLDDIHYHCSICDGGDFDLCQSCVDSGKLCPGDGHWLIKRSIQNGRMVSSTTERVTSKPKVQPQTEMEMPGAFTDDTKTLSDSSVRTCNACVVVLPDHDFVTCMQCDDYDLCRGCHIEMNHGHHPAHHFKPAVDGVELTLAEEALLPAGRNVRHGAICDGCDKAILGVRHKCFNCPDFDYCSECLKTARLTHPRHRFAAIYDPIPARRSSSVVHHGIYCDGPLCKKQSYQSYIQGVRYKCVVCHDTDFCESCEALPGSHHNRTHPLVKFKTPVNNLTISTENETKAGVVRKLGDRDDLHPRAQPAPVPAAPQPNNSTTPVKTVADIKPSPQAEEKRVEAPLPQISQKPLIEGMPFRSAKAPTVQLQGHFVRDRIADGTVIAPNARFTQVWTIRNPGPAAWSAGCSVRFVGGDNMLNVDNAHASSVSDIAEATESNVIGREVQPGEEIGFAVRMKAPVREGRSISYWRLKSADGTPFGHRLWCDINVKSDASKALDTSAGDVPEPSSVASTWKTTSQPINIPPTNNQSYYALYKERMDVLKSRLDQISIEDQKTTDEQKAEPSLNCSSTEKAQSSVVSAQPEESKPEVQPSETKVAGEEVQTSGVQQDEGELKGSQMIFPTLDRESPSNSTYQSFSGSGTEKSKYEEPDSSTNTGYEGFEEVSDDLEVLSANDDDESDDDGFLTDEEYDVLDASDQETIASMK